MTRSADDVLAPDTGMGAVTVRVGDLDAMIDYYRDAVTLQLISQATDSAVLGRGSTPIVILQHAPQLTAPEPRAAGLFHAAILFETQAALAAAVYSVTTKHPGTFIGSADHLVSEAFYFTDPEGNGIELYWDRSRTAWSWAHGTITMATLYLDPNAYLRQHLTEGGIADPIIGGAAVGHVHLSVGDIASARDFYVDKLGFETTMEIGGSALFVSAGGYHHHMAMNTWNSSGAGRRRLTLGLGEVDIVVPGTDDLGALGERMRHYGVETRDDGRMLSFDDPWANRVVVRTA
ncbi:VOC family protein [Luethyella okanaganae]|uniref:VOC family protein n=1 Tax=Luethyella okanaganae TaxID=69372 RepID=A0ABW1VFI9_9MICO